MKEIGIAAQIAAKRREKGITQEELASYLGITKASVSKWETGSSYPDIFFLPRLAAYFHISIDELMCYTPQMTEEDIKKTMMELREEFGKIPFGNIKEKCEAIISKYYSCIPLLMQMILLYVNHYMLADSREEAVKMLEDALELCNRVQEDGENVQIQNGAMHMKAMIYQLLGKPEQVLELLGEEIKPDFSERFLIISAFQMQGNVEKAIQLTQVNLYSHLNDILETMAKYLQLCAEDEKKTDEIIKRGTGLINSLQMEKVFANAVIRFYFQAAVIQMGQEKKEEALSMLEHYTNVGLKLVENFSFHGDYFFDRLSETFGEMEIKNSVPRSQKTISTDILAGLCNDEIFGELKENKKYQNLAKKLKSAVEESHEWRK